MLGRHFIVTGLVQGVCFRQSACQEARQLGLTGWVKNLADGSVELAAFGSETALTDLAAWLQQGPDRARVDQVSAKNIPFEDRANFEITY